jgi:hypothetical protein
LTEILMAGACACLGIEVEGLSPEVAHFHRRRRYPERALLQGDPGDMGLARLDLGPPGGAGKSPFGRSTGPAGLERQPPGDAGPSFVVEWDLAEGSRRGVIHVLHVTRGVRKFLQQTLVAQGSEAH